MEDAMKLQRIGIPEYLPLSRQGMYFAAQYPACTYLCQRFAFVLADADA